MNLNDAIARMEAMLSEASAVPKGPSLMTVARVKALYVKYYSPRAHTHLQYLLFCRKRKSERRRLVDKKYHSMKKHNRRTDD